MGRQRILRFPEGFLWGTATSAYQFEGDNTNNQWYRWEQEGHILSGDCCGKAANWWEQAESDFARAEQLGNNALRLSLEWSRLEPTEGSWDGAAVDRYRAMLANLRERGLKPIITLHHFTEPLWFADRGSFTVADNVAYFVRYVTRAVRSLRDLCAFWITFNEPNVYTALGYVLGSYPPGTTDLARARGVVHNLVLAHAEAFYAIRDLQPEGQIGFCQEYRLFDPARNYSPFDRGIAWLHEASFSRAFLESVETGRCAFPLSLLISPVRSAAGARDFHGINYYSRERLGIDPTLPSEMFVRSFESPGAVYDDPGWDGRSDEIYPAGLYRALKAVYRRTRGNKPLYITENGVRDGMDTRRPRALLEYLAMVHRAIAEGVPVRGYLHWSLIDNFEWIEGWGRHLGLIALDHLTQERIPRKSAALYGEICRANAITGEMVERYAPEAMERIFPPAGPVVALASRKGRSS